MRTQLFSERYSTILDKDGFETSFDVKFCAAVFRVLMRFDEPHRVYPDRYDQWAENSTTQQESYTDLVECGRYEISAVEEVTEEFLISQKYEIWLDLIEVWYIHLSAGERSPFQEAINETFSDYDLPWRLVEGQIVRIDSRQFECDLKIKHLKLLQGTTLSHPLFQSALDEYRLAIEAFNRRDYKGTILNAERSYESVLKIVCDVKMGTASALTERFKESKYIKNIPDEMRGSFKENVLMSLPIIRNKGNVGHGDGLDSIEISKELANLSLNLCASLCTYVIDVYQKAFDMVDDDPCGQMPF